MSPPLQKAAAPALDTREPLKSTPVSVHGILAQPPAAVKRLRGPPNPKEPALSVGAGKKSNTAALKALDANAPVRSVAEEIAALKGVEAWWSGHVWKACHRGKDRWLRSNALCVDLDFDGPLAPEVLAAAVAALRPADVNLVHGTRHGLRAIVVLEEPCSTRALVERAIAGLTELVHRALEDAEVTGQEVDWPATSGLGSIFYAPNATKPCTKGHAACEGGDPVLSAEVHLLRERPWSVEELAALPPFAAAKGARGKGGGGGKGKGGKGKGKRLQLPLPVDAVEDASQAVVCMREATPRSRHETLKKSAFIIGLHVAAGHYEDPGDVRAALHDAAVAVLPPARHGEVDRTITDMFHLAAARHLQQRALQGPPERAKRPKIYKRGGQLDKVLEGSMRALPLAPNLYQRGGDLVRVEEKGLGISIRPLKPDRLAAELTGAANYIEVDEVTGVESPCDCPLPTARAVLDAEFYPGVRDLAGLANCHTLREPSQGGGVIDTHGYDAASKLYVDLRGYSAVPVKPDASWNDARRALDELLELLHFFPFGGMGPGERSADRSVALAAILTALVRQQLRTAPMFLFTATCMGTGKSLLADLVALIATGSVAQALSQARDPAEAAKRYLAILRQGTQVVNLDNLSRDIEDDILASILTQELWGERGLGFNELINLPTKVTFLGTGNGIAPRGDLVTRVLTCELDAKTEHPEEREFPFKPRAFAREHRGRLVAAGLTVILAYQNAGTPSPARPVLGRFEEWSDLIRSSLVWLGEPDPCDVRAKGAALDPVREHHAALLAAMGNHSGLHDTPPVTARRLVEISRGCEPQDERLRAALEDVALGADGKPDPRKLGIYLKRFVGRRIGFGGEPDRSGRVTLWLERSFEPHTKVALWRVDGC